MADIECITKKWGNSLGVILPSNLVKEEQIGPNDKVMISIKKIHKVKEFFGLLPNWKPNTQKLKDELRKGWDI